MSDSYYINSGTWHTCPICGKRFFTTSPGEYVFKRPTKTENGATVVYFCKRKTGKWIEIKRNDVNPITGKCGVYVGCSECGAPLPTDSMLDFINESDCKFCYNCGTKMEVLIN